MKSIEDRTVRSIIPLARIDEPVQRPGHGAQFRDLGIELTQMSKGDRFHLGAGAIPIGPQCEQVADPLDRESEIAGATYEGQAMEIVVAIDPVVAGAPVGWADQPDRFIVPDHLGRHAGRRGCLSDLHPEPTS